MASRNDTFLSATDDVLVIVDDYVRNFPSVYLSFSVTTPASEPVDAGFLQVEVEPVGTGTFAEIEDSPVPVRAGVGICNFNQPVGRIRITPVNMAPGNQIETTLTAIA